MEGGARLQGHIHNGRPGGRTKSRRWPPGPKRMHRHRQEAKGMANGEWEGNLNTGVRCRGLQTCTLGEQDCNELWVDAPSL
eukprot:3301598-Alexandrium_andersonii.AAC.1